MATLIVAVCVVYAALAKKKQYYPLTDPHNVEGWTPFEAMTDEFSGNTLDSSKWYNHNPSWKGRAPALFEQSNVRMHNGTLELWAEYDNPVYPPNDGYHDWSTSAVQSVATLLYGYVEISAKIGSSKISSSFWFSRNDGGDRTEIDVFESSGPEGNTQNFYGAYHENTHIFALNGVSNGQIASKCHCKQNSANSDCSDAFIYTPPPPFHDFASSFHTYGMNWTQSKLITYLDGKQVRNIDNYCLDYALNLQFDRETMPDWIGMPTPSEMPDQPFQIEYVRAWKQT